MLDSGLETLVLRALAFEAAEEEFEARRIYFHNGVVTIALWFVLVPQVRALHRGRWPCTQPYSGRLAL